MLTESNIKYSEKYMCFNWKHRNLMWSMIGGVLQKFTSIKKVCFSRKGLYLLFKICTKIIVLQIELKKKTMRLNT